MQKIQGLDNFAQPCHCERFFIQIIFLYKLDCSFQYFFVFFFHIFSPPETFYYTIRQKAISFSGRKKLFFDFFYFSENFIDLVIIKFFLPV